MTTDILLAKSPTDASSDPLWAPIPSDVTELDNGSNREAKSCTPAELFNTQKLEESLDFSIDELREIARHFGVPDRAQITEREKLVDAIRQRI